MMLAVRGPDGEREGVQERERRHCERNEEKLKWERARGRVLKEGGRV